jgi:tRNA (guanosine-2'-O-)-methyltransferase
MPNDKEVAAAEMLRLVEQGTTRDPHWFTFGERRLTPGEVVDLLLPFVTEERMRRIAEVLSQRTYNLTVVLDGMVDTGNVAAVMRTADGFGLQSFHAVDTAGTYKHSRRTAQGAQKWLDRYRWRAAAACVEYLRSNDYRLLAAHVDPAATPIDSVDFGERTALVFGNELAGVSNELLGMIDDSVFIPISGFVESYNVSVAAGVCLHVARRDRMVRLGRHGDLIGSDRDRLEAVFMMKSVKHHRALIERLLSERDDLGPG